jgi:uncharacterized membrane protein
MTVQLTESIIVKGDPSELFDLWENYEMFPTIMQDLKEVQKLDAERSRWVVKGPLGKDFEWIAQITRHEEDRRIAWKTLEGDIKTSGQVTFNELPHNETEVTVMMQYVPPAGKVGDVVSKLTTNPREKLNDGLRDFKRYAENRPDKLNKDKTVL